MSTRVEAPVERRALSIDEFATTLGIGRSTAWDLVRRGELRAIRIGDRQLVPISEIERFIASKLAGGPAA